MNEYDFEGIPRGGVSFRDEAENDPIIFDKEENSYRSLSSLKFRSSSNQAATNSSSRTSKTTNSRPFYIDHEERMSSLHSDNSRRTSSKPQLSSTLKSYRSSAKLFEPNISEIPKLSQIDEQNLSRNESTKININLFDNIDLGDTTIKSTNNQKCEKRSENSMSKNNNSSTYDPSQFNDIYQKLKLDESSKLIAQKFCENVNSPRPNSKSKKTSVVVPKEDSIEAHVAREASRCPPISKETNGPEIAIKPAPFSHWGFVAVKESVQQTISVQNISSKVLAVTPIIKDQHDFFQLTSHDTVYIEPKAFAEFGIIFTPNDVKRYKQKIFFLVGSSGKQYGHILFGYGGTANVEIVQKSCITYFSRESVYRCSLNDRSHFTFEVENIGARSSFVHIVPCDENGHETRQIKVTPESFLLASKNLDGTSQSDSKQKITVKVSDQYMQQINRMSLDSFGSSSSSSATKNCLLNLKVYFGDERLRQRATRFSEENNCHQTYRGLLLTKTPFLLKNESTVDIKDGDPVSKQDIEMLKAQTRVITLIVGDDRIGNSGTLSLASRPPSSSSSSSRHSSTENGYYLPKYDNGNESIISNITVSDRTFYR